MSIQNCCKHNNKSKKCKRKSDGKIFIFQEDLLEKNVNAVSKDLLQEVHVHHIKIV